MRMRIYPSGMITMISLLILDAAVIFVPAIRSGDWDAALFRASLLLAFTLAYYLWMWHQYGPRLLGTVQMDEKGISAQIGSKTVFSAAWEEIAFAGEFVAINSRGAYFLYFSKEGIDFDSFYRKSRRKAFYGSDTLLVMELMTKNREGVFRYYPHSRMIQHGKLMW